jgi:hypothetical protein
MHLQIEWMPAEDSQRTETTWEPMTQVYRDQPELVRNYFSSQGMNVQSELQEDNRRCGNTKTNTSKGAPQKNQDYKGQLPKSLAENLTPAERAK